MDITFNCEKCGQNIVIDEAGAGITIDCPKCGQPTYVPSKSSSLYSIPIAEPSIPPSLEATVVRTETPAAYNAQPKQAQRVYPGRVSVVTTVAVTDIQIPFWRLVVIMIKWGIASIPAAIVLMIIFFVLWAFFGLLGVGLLSHGLR